MIERNNQRYYNAKEIAANLSTTVSAVNQTIRRYLNEIDKYIVKYKSKNDYRPVRYVSEKGVAILMNLKKSSASNQFTKKDSYHEQNKQYKKHVVETAIEANDPKSNLQIEGKLSTYVKALLEVTIKAEQNEERLKELEGDVALLKGDTSKYPIREGQRRILNERVRGFAINLKAPFNKVWSKLHQSVGRKSIDDYVFEDYTLALSIIDDWVEKFNVKF